MISHKHGYDRFSAPSLVFLDATVRSTQRMSPGLDLYCVYRQILAGEDLDDLDDMSVDDLDDLNDLNDL